MLSAHGLTFAQPPAKQSVLGIFRVWLAVNADVYMRVTFGFCSRWSHWEVATIPPAAPAP